MKLGSSRFARFSQKALNYRNVLRQNHFTDIAFGSISSDSNKNRKWSNHPTDS